MHAYVLHHVTKYCSVIGIWCCETWLVYGAHQTHNFLLLLLLLFFKKLV